MAECIRLAVNPADTTQKLKLWTNGRIDGVGGAPVPSDNPTWFNNPVGEPAVAFQVVNWATPSGYVLDFFGVVHAFGGATAPSSQAPNSNPFPIYRDFVMNPAGNGQGYVLRSDGQVFAIGGAGALSTGLSLALAARRIKRDWGSGKTYVFDGYGNRYPFGGAVDPNPTSVGWPGLDIARDLEILDWDTGRGYVMDGYGGIHTIKQAESAPGGPYWSGWDVARDLAVLDEDPLRMAILDGQGAIHEWVISDPPTGLAGSLGGPALVTDTTTRPYLTFQFDDPNGDSMKSADVYMFKESDVATFEDEVITLTMLGSPTGGTFRLQVEGVKTGTLNHNASAGTIETALQALPGCEDVQVTGGPINTTPVVVTFGGARGKAAQLMLRYVNNNLTGGSSPRIELVRTVAGADITKKTTRLAKWKITDPNSRSVQPDFDLDNDYYRFFVRVQDSAGLRSGWTSMVWVQSVDRPNSPELSATDRGGTAGIGIGVTLTDPPDGGLLSVEFADDYTASDPEAATWKHLRGLLDEAGDPTYGPLANAAGVNEWPTTDNIAKAVELGLSYMRWGDEWQWNQPNSNPASLDISNYIADVAAVHAAGMGVIHVLLGVPDWINPHSNVSYPASGGYSAIEASGHWFPTNQAGCDLMADWAEEMCSHLDPDRDFVELWNEPNIEAFNRGLYQEGRTGAGAPFYQSEADYMRMIITLVRRIRSRFPRLRIILGSVASVGDINAGSVNSMWQYTLRCIYNAPSILTSDRPNYFGVHPYGWGGGVNAGLDTPTNDAAAIEAGAQGRTPGVAYPWSSPRSNKGWNGHVQALQMYNELTNLLGGVNPNLMVTEFGSPGARDPEFSQFTGGSRTSGVVTLTGGSGHGLRVGDEISVDAADSSYDGGPFVISATTSSTITYPQPFVADDASAGAVVVSWESAVGAEYPEGWQAIVIAEDMEVNLLRLTRGIYQEPLIIHTLYEDPDQGIGSTDRYLCLYRKDGTEKPSGAVFRGYMDQQVSTGVSRTLTDAEAPFTLPRYYRASIYTPDPYLSSPYSEVVSATLSIPNWVLSIVGDPASQQPVAVVPPFRFSQQVVGYVAYPSGTDESVAITDGGPRGMETSLQIRALDKATDVAIRNILNSGKPIQLRSVLGDSWYLRVVGKVDSELIRAQPSPADDPSWPIRWAYLITAQVAQIPYPTFGTGDIPATVFEPE